MGREWRGRARGDICMARLVSWECIEERENEAKRDAVNLRFQDEEV